MKAPSDFGVRDADLTDIVIANDLKSARRSEEQIMRKLECCRYSPDCIFAIKLAFEEALTNAVKHGNSNDVAKRLVVRYFVDIARVVLVVRDEGCGFKVSQIPDPTRDENIERPSGRGIMLMHAYMSRVRFNRAGNEVWMLKENQDQRAARTG